MRNTWVLSIKTSLPEVCRSRGDLKTSFFAFESFEEARAALRKVLKKLAYTKNSMFDGKGNIIYFNNYIENLTYDEDSDYYDDDFLTSKKLKTAERALKNIFKGKDAVPKIKDGFYTNYMIAYTYENGEINFRGDDDGPCNGYDPVLRTNMFDMLRENNYFLYIDDVFGQDEATTELYIDLLKAEDFEE
ncbi:MAG: hypothetical protein IKK94_07720 [Clostridia bacterium]|nr:hypothetical protein [Clostridia bacterium]